MSKFFGKIGFGITQETSDGVWEVDISEKDYIVDILRSTRKTSNGDGLNDNVELNIEFSILLDSFACQNMGFIRYVDWLGSKWKVTSVTPEYPRLRITVGGVWND